MSWKQWNIGEVVEAGDFQSLVQDQVVQTYADAAARGSALGTAVSEGMVAYTSDDNTLSVYNGSQWGQVAQAISPNYIINGAFDIWQRGTSFTANSVYNADRWFNTVSTSVSGLSRTVTREPLDLGAITAIGYGEGSFFLRDTINTIGLSTAPRLRYRIEDCRVLAAESGTLSLWLRSSTHSSSQITILQNFGSGGSAQVTVSDTSVTITSSWQRYAIPLTFPSISGKTIGDANFLEIRIANAQSDAATLDIWGVQLEAGSVATPFRRNANSIQGELAACQRYYQQYGTNTGTRFANGMAQSTTAFIANSILPVQMRATPTGAFSAATTFAVSNATGSRVTLSAISLAAAIPTNITLSGTVASGLVAGNATELYNAAGQTWSIGLSAEL